MVKSLQMLKLIKSIELRQYTVVIIANITVINIGLSVVWASPMLIKFRDESETILTTPPTEEQEAWIVSISLLFGIPVLLTTGTLMSYLGRKTLLLFMYIPRMIMCFLVIFASELWMILVARAFSGIADVMAMSAVSTYASEVAGKKIRGASGTLMQIMSAVGMMIMFSVGPFVSYLAVNIMMACILALTFIPLQFIPESPYFLYSKGRTHDAIEVLKTLRGSDELAHEEIKEYSSLTDTIVDAWSHLKDRIVLKTFALVIFLSIGFNLIGYNSVNFYLQSIFESTQTSISSEVSSLIIGVIQLLACICTFFLTDRFGRKPILCISLVGMFIGMIGLGTFFVVFENGIEITGFLNYLPLISIMIIIYGFNAGMGSLFWIVVAELFEGPIRPYGVSCSILFCVFSSFLLTLFFPALINCIGAAAIYFFFSGGCALVCLVIFFFVPETKGKTFIEIQTALGRTGMNDLEKSLKPRVTYGVPILDCCSRNHQSSYGILTGAFPSFLLTFYFPALMNSIGAAAVYYIFAGGCASLCDIFFVTKTKGKPFTEIETALGRNL